MAALSDGSVGVFSTAVGCVSWRAYSRSAVVHVATVPSAVLHSDSATLWVLAASAHGEISVYSLACGASVATVYLRGRFMSTARSVSALCAAVGERGEPCLVSGDKLGNLDLFDLSAITDDASPDATEGQLADATGLLPVVNCTNDTISPTAPCMHVRAAHPASPVTSICTGSSDSVVISTGTDGSAVWWRVSGQVSPELHRLSNYRDSERIKTCYGAVACDAGMLLLLLSRFRLIHLALAMQGPLSMGLILCIFALWKARTVTHFFASTAAVPSAPLHSVLRLLVNALWLWLVMTESTWRIAQSVPTQLLPATLCWELCFTDEKCLLRRGSGRYSRAGVSRRARIRPSSCCNSMVADCFLSRQFDADCCVWWLDSSVLRCQQTLLAHSSVVRALAVSGSALCGYLRPCS